jgi:GDPmannose 4,6-dehydratase
MKGEGKSALVTGIRGQDGWYLAEALLKFGYAVTGTTHQPDAERSLHVGERQVPMVQLDLADTNQVEQLIQTHHFDEVYNLAARASSAQLFDDPIATSEINGVAVARFLESIKRHSPSTRFCQASSSEVFAGSDRNLQDESTPRIPRNAYGAAKAFGDHLVTAYRTTYGIFACSAILFSHESPRRSPHFVVRKITQAAARIATGRIAEVRLDNVVSIRDWGYAPDYVEAMTRMLHAGEPRDYVIATGQAHTVQDVCEAAFGFLGLDWRAHVTVEDQSGRAPDQVARVGDASRAAAELGWAPTRTFTQIVEEMVRADLALLEPAGTDDADAAALPD